MLVHGWPAEVIRPACEGACDLLVTGSRSYPPMQRALLGSVSEQLAEGASLPVLVVPHGAAAPEDGGNTDRRSRGSTDGTGILSAMLDGMNEAPDIITVVLADDHAVVRKGLRLLLEAEPGLRVVAEAGTVADAMSVVQEHRPSVLVLDLSMPDGSGLAAIPVIREEAPATAIVVLTMQNDPSFARQALQGGALGFVLKEAADDELLGAIRLAADGETYLNPRLGARLAAQPSEPPGPPDDLSAASSRCSS